MIQIYDTHYCAVRDTAGLITRFPAVPEWIDRMAADLCAALGIEMSVETRRIPVLISDGDTSEVRNGQIVVVPREDNRCDAGDWFEMLFRHEFTHWLTSRFWGKSLVLFWEGLPIYLADNQVRQRIFGFSYHQFCAALLERNVLLPLHSIVLPDRYYGMSHDFRVAAQSGSFTGYLVETYGMATFQQAYTAYIPPTPNNPQLLLTNLFTRVWQQLLTNLEHDWCAWLHDHVERHPEAEAIVGKRGYPEKIDIQAVHCKFCCAPIPGYAMCPACGANQHIDIALI